MNIVEGILKEIDRCNELIAVYNTIPLGAFGAVFIQKAIDEGKSAIASGDAIECIRCYKELELCE